MYTRVPTFGSSIQQSDLAFCLQDQLNAMGDYLTQEIGSLNWIECMTNARAITGAKELITLLSNQLSPNSSSIFLDRWAKVYNQIYVSGNGTEALQQYIELKQSQFGTPPTLNNITQYLQQNFASIFIDLEVEPLLQSFAATSLIPADNPGGLPYYVPLSQIFIYVWQPRDNQDNLLMTNAQFNSIIEQYKQNLQQWCGIYYEFITLNLTNRGNQDGYGGGYAGLNFNNYLDGYNVISATLGSSTIIGTNTVFNIYNNGQPGDFREAIDAGFNPPIQVVDDSGALQTYYVKSISGNSHLTITSTIKHNITNRTYRCIGEVLDINGMLDNGQLSASGWTD